MTRNQAIHLISISILGNTFLGILLFFSTSIERIRAKMGGGYKKAFYMSTVGLGLLFSVGISFIEPGGDVENILMMLNIGKMRTEFVFLGFVIIILASIAFWTDFRSIEEEYTLRTFANNLRKRLKDL